MDVDKMQTKLATWAQRPAFRFDDIYNLVYDKDFLRRAYGSVASNAGSSTPGVDGQTIDAFESRLEENLERLQGRLKAQSYVPRPVRRTYIPKGDDRRPLGIPTIEDRIVQETLRMVLEPIYETDFSDYSFGFRPNRSAHDAIKATYLAMMGQKKMLWVIDADIKGFFDNVDHQRLEQIIQNRVTDQKLRDLIWAFLRAGVMEEGTYRHSKIGTPQGGIVSPLLANVYLNELDQWARQWTDLSSGEKTKRRRRGKGNWRYVRYADDFLLLTNGGRKHAETMMRRLEAFINEELNLTLSRKKTTLTHANDGFDFLGYHLKRRRSGNGGKTVRWTIPKDAVRNLRSDVRAATDGGTGISVRAKMKALNMKLRGWANYYKYATDAAQTFSALDHFVWKRVMNWLATKYRSSVPKVIENQLDSKSPISINGQTLKKIGGESAIYRASYKHKEHPYLTDRTDQQEELPSGEFPPENPWLGNVEWRPGWSDQRWRALERDGWTCQKCGADLVDEPANVHHQRAYAGYSCEERANSLGNLISLCAGCHREVESNRTYT